MTPPEKRRRARDPRLPGRSGKLDETTLALVAAVFGFVTSATGCSADAAGGGALPPPSSRRIACTDPRPEVCTQQYDPVCSTVDTGIRCVTTPCPSTEQRTDPNGCVACSDERVLSYGPGACEEGD